MKSKVIMQVSATIKKPSEKDILRTERDGWKQLHQYEVQACLRWKRLADERQRVIMEQARKIGQLNAELSELRATKGNRSQRR